MFEHGFSFDQWVVTPDDCVVSGPYGETRLEPRVLAVLVELAASAGQVVSRNALIDRVWGGAVVGDEVLSRCIYRIRQALGESSRDPRFIQTVPKRGYRLNAKIIDLSKSEQSLNTDPWQQGSPFRGLQVFDVDHAAVFFGRASATREALVALEQQVTLGKAFLLLLGASGVGKSSLARAGLLFNLLHSNRYHDIECWWHAVFRPGGSKKGPVSALVDALSRALELDAAGTNGLLATLNDAAAAFPDSLSHALQEHVGKSGRIVLVVDQLEEIFSGRHISNDERHLFFDTLECLASSGTCWIIATMRSDFYPYCVAYPALMRLKKGGGQYDVRPLRPGEIRQTIRFPAQAAGLAFERRKDSGVPLDDVLYEITAEQPRLLPLLEFTLQALYDNRTDDGKLTFEAYEKLGGMEGSLARRADEVFNDLPAAQRDTLPQVISGLVRIGDGRESVASCALSAFPGDDARGLVRAFVDARLFSAELDSEGEPRITVTHEALLTHWPRIGEWIAENRDLIRIRERIRTARERWLSEDKRDDLLLPRGKTLEDARELVRGVGIELSDDDLQFIDASKRRAGRRRILERAATAALLVLTFAAAGLAWQAASQRDLAIEQTAIAEREALAARETANFLIEVFESADPNRATGGQLTARRILDEGVARLDDGLVRQGALRTRLRALIARAYKGLGLGTDAEALLRRADAEASEFPELGERERLAIRFQLADVLLQRGDLAAAEPLHAEVLEKRQALFGNNDLDTVESMEVRAHELWRNGQIAGAVRLFEQVLQTRQELLGERHRLVTDMLTTLGTLYYLQNLPDEAETYYRAAAEQADEVYGPRSIGTAIALSNLALVESNQKEREALLNRSLSIRQEVLGPEHTLTARAEQILAEFYAETGDAVRAEALYRQSIRKLESGAEPTPILPTVQNEYARFLESKGRFDEAIAVFAKARDNFASLSGDKHRWTLRVHGNLGYAHFLAGNSSTAEEILKHAIANAETSDTATDVAAADLKRLLADVYVGTGRGVGALPLAKFAVDVYEGDVEVHRTSLADALGILAEGHLLAGQPDDALASVTRAIELDGGVSDSEIAIYNLLAGIALAHGNNCSAALPMLNVKAGKTAESPYTKRKSARIAALAEDARSVCNQ